MQEVTSTLPATALNWFYIPANDLDRAVRFYGTILEAPLRVGDFGGERVAVFAHREDGAGGALVKGTPSSAGTLVYLTADGRLDRALALVEGAGGSIAVPKAALPNGMGYSAEIIDSEGNRVGLHANP
jgi:predicted enzyme related to lactoylglutathione lyase